MATIVFKDISINLPVNICNKLSIFEGDNLENDRPVIYDPYMYDWYAFEKFKAFVLNPSSPGVSYDRDTFIEVYHLSRRFGASQEVFDTLQKYLLTDYVSSKNFECPPDIVKDLLTFRSLSVFQKVHEFILLTSKQFENGNVYYSDSDCDE